MQRKGSVIPRRHLIGVAQVGATLGDVPANVRRGLDAIREASEQGIELLVFPECSLSGYAYSSRAEIEAAAITRDGAEIQEIAAGCAEHGIHVVVGYLETSGEKLYNTATLIGPDGVVGSYRKAHLPTMAADRFIDVGTHEDPPVFDTPLGKVGIAICYDLRFPESARTLALAGAEIIAQPTNSVSQSSVLFDHFTVVRACENRVYLAICNRPDEERNMDFVGRSQILSPAGDVLVEAGPEESIVKAEADLAAARDKKIVLRADDFELSVFADRRPDLYSLITTEPDDLDPVARGVGSKEIANG